MFTGLALATGWRQIKAAERTTNSSLITPSFVFTNTSGTNYVFIVREQERTSPDSTKESRLFVKCGLSLMVNPKELNQQFSTLLLNKSENDKQLGGGNHPRDSFSAQDLTQFIAKCEKKTSSFQDVSCDVQCLRKHVYCPLDEGCGICRTPPPRRQQLDSGHPERGAYKHNNTTCTHTIRTN